MLQILQLQITCNWNLEKSIIITVTWINCKDLQLDYNYNWPMSGVQHLNGSTAFAIAASTAAGWHVTI